MNPKIEEGDATERRNAIELLNEMGQVVMPLEHAPLLEDRRAGRFAFRDYELSTGKKDPRGTEKAAADAGAITTALQSADNAENVDKLYEALTLARSGCAAIKNVCMLADSGAFSPQFDNLEEVLRDMIALFEDARPDLAGGGDTAADGATEEGAEGAPGEDGAPVPVAGGNVSVSSGPPVMVGPVPNHATAKAALEQIEAYFASVEPSAPALLLIRQAQDLFGKPLTEALEALLPGMSGNAIVDFGSKEGFMLDFGRMSQLAAYELPAGAVMVDTGPAEPVVCENREQAAALLSAVENFFRQTEPSSPVPVLLFKAKTYLNRDFSSIIGDLFQHMDQPG